MSLLTGNELINLVESKQKKELKPSTQKSENEKDATKISPICADYQALLKSGNFLIPKAFIKIPLQDGKGIIKDHKNAKENEEPILLESDCKEKLLKGLYGKYSQITPHEKMIEKDLIFNENYNSRCNARKAMIANKDLSVAYTDDIVIEKIIKDLALIVKPETTIHDVLYTLQNIPEYIKVDINNKEIMIRTVLTVICMRKIDFKEDATLEDIVTSFIVIDKYHMEIDGPSVTHTGLKYILAKEFTSLMKSKTKPIKHLLLN